MIQVMPTRPGVASYSYDVALEGREITLSWRWLPRLSRWSLDVVEQGADLVRGRVVEANVDLLRGCRFTGVLFASSESAPVAPDLQWTGVGLWWAP